MIRLRCRGCHPHRICRPSRPRYCIPAPASSKALTYPKDGGQPNHLNGSGHRGLIRRDGGIRSTICASPVSTSVRFTSPLPFPNMRIRCVTGVQIHVTDRDQFKPVDVALHLIATVRQNYPDQFEFIENRGRYFFDLLAGTDGLRLRLMKRESATEIVQSWETEVTKFNERRRLYLLYD